jgi:hypothetical protein
MKPFAALLLFAMAPNPVDYTARVHFKQVHSQIAYEGRTETINSVHAEGFGRIEEPGKPTQRFEFSFNNCNRPNPNPDGFPARWKSPKEIHILIPAKDGKPDDCTLKIKLIEPGNTQTK